MAKLRFAVRKFDPFERALEKCWAAYQERNNSNVQMEFVPLDLEELTAAFFDENGLNNGDWDIVHINTDWMARAYEGEGLCALDAWIARLPPEGYPNAWSPSLTALQNFEGGVYGLPFHDGPECLVVRKDLFESKEEQRRFQERYGRALEVPTTWDDFLMVADFFTRPAEGLYGTVFAGYPDGHNAVFDFFIQLWTRGAELAADGQPIKIDQPTAVAALDFYRGLFQTPSGLHPKSLSYESVQAGQAFARGEVAMMVNWFGFASWAQIDKASAVQGKVDVAPIPANTKEGSCSLNVYWLYAIPEGSRYKDVAYDFIRFAVSKENDRLLTLEGGVGCRYSTWDDAEINQAIPFYSKLKALHENAHTLPRLANWTQIAHIIDETVTRAITSELSSLSLLKEAQHKINKWI